jgi:hypothetical protein
VPLIETAVAHAKNRSWERSVTGKLLVWLLNKNKTALPLGAQRPKHGLLAAAVPATHALRMATNKPNYTASRLVRPQSSTQFKSVGNILLHTNTFMWLCLY